jgi:hypothetical protein
MKWNNHYSKLLIACVCVLAACYPQGPEFVEDTDVVFTNYNPEFNFKAKTTFAIPTKIVKITGNAITGDPPKYIPDVLAAPMLAKMEANLTALGYTKVDISANPSLILAPAALETTTIVYWYDYWGWYWGGYYPGWGYPWYPYYPTATSYSTGTLVMLLIDPTVVSGDGNPKGQWTAGLNGILTSSYDINRVNKLIDQAFVQSPYLKK